MSEQNDSLFIDAFPDKNKKRAERRKTNVKKALRKKKISQDVMQTEWYKSLHQYSKNKVFCSCPMCSGMFKTNQKKMRGVGQGTRNTGSRCYITTGTTNHRNGKNWSVKDQKTIEKLKFQEDNE